MNKIKVNGFERITKKEAFGLYKKGKTVYLCASNMRPCSESVVSIQMTVSDVSYALDEFDKKVNSFFYYNCNAETGKKVNYFKEETQDVKLYRLSADFGNTIRLIDMQTGKTVDMNKLNAVAQVKEGHIKIMGYSVNPSNNGFVAYR